MRILIWSPNYAPELIGIPPLVTEAAEWLASRGHEVDVVTALPNYPERMIFPDYSGRAWRSDEENGVRVHRSWLRVRPGETFFDKGLYEASFAALSAPRALSLFGPADVLVCLVPTLFTTALGALGARATRTRLVVWVQDLVLDAAHSIDRIGRLKGRVLGGLRKVEGVGLRKADRVVSCSAGFVPYLIQRGADSSRLDTIPNWVDVERFQSVSDPPTEGGIRFLYTGNIGYTQGFETLLTATDLVGDGVAVEIVGGGNFVDIARCIARPPVRVRPAVPRDAYPALLASAHALVVLQRRVAANVNLPSKIASYLASGRPIVASMGLDTPAADMLRASGGALVVPPEDPEALAASMRRLSDDARLRTELGARGREYAVAHLAKERVLPRLEIAIVGDDPSRMAPYE
jgi:colanic acid biosynthesis glycosyl transferase WcaI